MIQFFRRIRHGLLTENRLSKYFLYAIGEIVLVVIGILIALQLNNWNEDRKKAIELRAGLVAVVKEIDNNIEYLQDRIERINDDLEDLETSMHLLNGSDTDTLNNEDIVSLIQEIGPFTHLPLREVAYRNLINSNMINNILNDTLKLRIRDIEIGYQIYEEERDKMYKSWEEHLKPYYMKNADIMGIVDTLHKKPNPMRQFQSNITAFANNREFSNIITQRLFSERASKKDFEIVIRNLTTIRSQIEGYLETH